MPPEAGSKTKRASRMSRFFLILACSLVSFIVILTFVLPQAKAADPTATWKIIETEHFQVVYDSRQQALGEAYARFAEISFAALAPTFGVWPDKTILIVDDSTDSANGTASPWPYPTIVAYPVLPTSLDSIGDFGDWGLELVLHEYVHILNFEPANGVMKPFRYVFGSIVRPNILLPRWYSEGLAVELETRYSRFGRLRSPTYLAIARSMVEENTLRNEDISRINESIPDWPGGNRPYLLGALMWNEIVRRGGDQMIGDLNTAYSKRIPFFIDGPVESRLGLDYAGLLNEVYSRVERESTRQLNAIKDAGVTKTETFGTEGSYVHSPQISPDGTKLLVIEKTHNIDSYVRIYERGSAKSFRESPSRILLKGDSIQRVSWLPDSSGFVYDSQGIQDRYYLRSDLHRFDFKENRGRSLTSGLRAREAVVSPDGKSIVFVQLTPASTRLASMSIDGSNMKSHYEPPFQTRISHPEFLNSREVIFAERRDDGLEVLKVLDLTRDGSEPRAVLREFAPAQFPTKMKQGLLFLSEKSGAANIYLADASLSSARPLTNVTTRAMGGAIDNTTGELIFPRLGSSGPALYSAPKSEWEKSATPPLIGPLVENTWPRFEKPNPDYTLAQKDYSALPYMIPQYWFPFASLVPEGAYFQAMTSASDPIGRHSYSLSAAVDTLTQKPSFVGQYINRTTPVTYSLIGQDTHDYIYSGDFTRKTTAGAFSGSFFLPKLSNNWRGSLGWQYLQTDFSNSLLVRNGASVGLSWANAKQKGLEISPESGGAASLRHTRFITGLGTIDYEQTELSGAYYFSKWLPERHAVALFANASYAPRLRETILGKTTIAGSFESNLIQDSFIVRGYRSGIFIGKNMVSSSLEYRFPISYTYSGLGTRPLFLRRIHGAGFVDGVSLDGLGYDYAARRYSSEKLGRFYYGTGLEVKFDATVFYHVPVQLIFGAYYGMEKRFNPDGLFPFLGLIY